jgi:hypothetical protein
MRETATASFEFVSLSRQPRFKKIKFRSHLPPGRARAEDNGKMMAPRDPEIPNHRERLALQLMTHGNWAVAKDLYPAGKVTVANLVRKGWIDQGIEPTGARQFRITQAGRAALAANTPSSWTWGISLVDTSRIQSARHGNGRWLEGRRADRLEARSCWPARFSR